MVATEGAILEAFQFNLCSPSCAVFDAVAQITHTLGPACPEPCAKTAFAIANDCFRFDLVLRHPPAVLAAACVHAAAAAHQLPGRQWLEQLDPASLPATIVVSPSNSRAVDEREAEQPDPVGAVGDGEMPARAPRHGAP